MRIKQTARKSCTQSASNKHFGSGFARKSCTTIRAVDAPAKIKNDVVNPPAYRRRSPGEKALEEIRKYQQQTKFIIERLLFHRLVRGLANGLQMDIRFHVAALEALQVFIYLYFPVS